MREIITDAKTFLRQRREALAAALQRGAVEAEAAAGEETRDLAEQREQSDIRARLGDREQLELNEVDAALARIAAGTYGHCETCGKAIGRQRLRAVPEARFCIGCRGGVAELNPSV